MMNLLQKTKIALRVSEDVFDDEVNMLIEAAKIDLEESGVRVDVDDSLVHAAIVFYVKANFGYDNTDSEKQRMSYEAIRRKLKLSSRWD